MDQIVFIPEEKVGILGTLVQNLVVLKGKRKKQSEFNSLERVLRGLKLLPPGAAAFSISWGCNHLGEIGVIVSLSPAARAIVSAPETL